jgi:disulfide bond formation protein DsbB
VAYTVITHGYAVLALIADALVLAALTGFLVARTSPERRERWNAFRNGITPVSLHLAWIVAMLAMLGSLYFSQVVGLVPCEFCWFQRICMYPLTLLLGIAAIRGDFAIAKRYFLTMSIVGSLLAIYHYQLEHIPQPSVCGAQIPCDVAAFNIFGFISIPFLSMAAFLLITTLLLLSRTPEEDEGEDEDEDEDDVDEPAAHETSDEAVPATA